jgi:hypothetical protein
VPKKKKLNGLPHNLVMSFLSTERFYLQGYMSDWLVNSAILLKINKAHFDINNETFYPNELCIDPFIYNLKTLPSIISKELKSNKFSEDFISEAVLKFEFPLPNDNRILHCTAFLKDINGCEYYSKPIFEKAYESYFDPFELLMNSEKKTQRKKSIINKIISYLNDKLSSK